MNNNNENLSLVDIMSMTTYVKTWKPIMDELSYIGAFVIEEKKKVCDYQVIIYEKQETTPIYHIILKAKVNISGEHNDNTYIQIAEQSDPKLKQLFIEIKSKYNEQIKEDKNLLVTTAKKYLNDHPLPSQGIQ